MIQLIFGKPRRGKTALMTALAVANMFSENAEERLENCIEEVGRLNKNGYNLTEPDDHLVYANYHIDTYEHDTLPDAASYEFDEDKLMLPNDEYDSELFPPYSVINFDEAQSKFNSRKGQNLSEYLAKFIEVHGHHDLIIRLAAQRFMKVDVTVRGLCEDFIEILYMKHKFKTDMFGEKIITQTTWHCKRYENLADLEDGTKPGKAWTYTFKGNIFDHYDCKQFKALFYSPNGDFSRRKSVKPSLTKEYIEAFRAAHKINSAKEKQKVTA